MKGKGKEPMVIDEKSNDEEYSSTISMENNITVILSSGDGAEFTVPFSVAKQSAVIAGIVNETEDGTADQKRVVKVPCELVSGQVLELMVRYWKEHSDDQKGGGSDSSTAELKKKKLKAWDKEFVKLENKLMFELVKGSHYLESIELMDLLCQTLADTIKDMSVEAVREFFDIQGDFTPEEEAKIKEDIKWVFDP
ncbi:hypothetical protein J5N97_020083 [Dioscorea zingiberensis]|uniref:SKP1-like protein n=1 Tax=Dioscorea zingiberensis TaxID=325984 RepID=A0A9D5HD36_9LILI|nr:hypothetical protein J5N97_020083 [Dioscorea zingiberensis]